MAAVRRPRTMNAAQALLERFAVVEGRIAELEAQRREELAAVNAEADKLIAPMLPERDDLLAKLSAWWAEAGAGLTEGKRKSITLGGCEIGSRKHPDRLGIAGDALEAAKALFNKRWSRDLVVVTLGVDRTAVLKSIDGAHAEDLKTLGFSRIEGDDVVFVKRVKQDGTIGAGAG